MNRYRLSPLAAVLLAIGHPALAQDAPALPTITVKASPVIDSSNADRHAGYSTRVTEAQVKDLGALDLAAALRLTPGVQISRYNEVGSYSGDQGGNVYIRGMGASRPGGEIKTYLDGIPLYMGLWNHPLLDLLPLNGIRTLDVQKGPQNMVSGNNFGAIHLTSKRATQEGLQGEAGLSFGSYATRVFQANVQARKGDVDLSLAASSIDSQGARNNADGRLRNAMGQLSYRINPAWSVGAGFLAVQNEVGDPGDKRFAVSASGIGPYTFSNGVARNDSASHLMSAYLAHRHGAWRGDVKAYVNNGHNNLLNDPNWGTFNSEFKMSGLRWKEEATLSPGLQLTMGIDHDRVSGVVAGPHVGSAVGTPFAFGTAGSAAVPTFAVSSAYAGLSKTISLSSTWTLQPSAGLRFYRSNIHGSKVAPNAGINLVSGNLSFFANLSTGLLYPGAETYALTRALPMAFSANSGWDRLSPSENRHTEIGLKWTPSARTTVDASLFQDRISKRYIWSGFFAGAIANPASGSWSNGFPDYTITGLEASLRHEFNPAWTAFVGLTLLRPSLNDLPYAPKTAVSIGVNGHLGPIRLSADAHFQTRMNSLTQDRGSYTPNPVDGFTVANLRLAYPMAALGKKGEVFLALNNLFGAQYQYNAGYPMPGRNVRVGVLAKF